MFWPEKVAEKKEGSLWETVQDMILKAATLKPTRLCAGV